MEKLIEREERIEEDINEEKRKGGNIFVELFLDFVFFKFMIG